MPSLLTLFLPVPLALAALLSRSMPARRLAWLAAIVYAVGAASVRVALRIPLGETADPLWVDALPLASLRIDAGLQLLAAFLAAGSAAISWTAHRTGGDRTSSLVALVSAVAVVASALPLLRPAGWPQTLAAAVALGAGLGIVGALLLGAATRLPASSEPTAPEPGSHFPGPARGISGALLGLGAVLAIAAPHLHLVIAGAILAAIAAHRIARRGPIGHIPFFPAVVTGLLAFLAYYLDIIAGPGGVSLAALPDAPLSTAAQAYLVPALAIGAVGFFGFWPFTVMTPGTWLVPIGVALLLRIGAATLPVGMDGWRTVAIPLGVIGVWAAALGRRPLALASAGAWMACFAPASGGASAAWLLTLVPVFGVHVREPVPERVGSRRSLIRDALLVAAASIGGTLAFDALLRVEVVYAVLAATAAAFSAVYISRAHT